MALEFVWWCNECEKEIESPESHAKDFPEHTYLEKMRWDKQTITSVVPQSVKDYVDAVLKG